MLRYFLIAFLIFNPIYGGILPKLPEGNLGKNGRIIGGVDIGIEEVPYQAALLYENPTFIQMGAGAIISPNVVISVAFHFTGAYPLKWKVRVGSTSCDEGGQFIDIEKVISHPNFTIQNSFDNDIAIIHLSSSIIIDNVSTKLIPLPSQDATVSDFQFGSITGWGFIRYEGMTNIYETNLQKIVLPVINQNECVEAYPQGYDVSPRMLCAGNIKTGGESPCYRDYGSPFVIDGILVGIYSWGGCNQTYYPVIFTRMASFKNWIDEQMSLL